jgi:hypothetical protein
MSEKAIGRIHAVCLSIRPLRDPALTIKGSTSLVSKESADTADGEHRRLSPGSGRRLMNNLNEQSFHCHTLLFLSWFNHRQLEDSNAVTCCFFDK